MSSTVKGFAVRVVDSQHGKQELGHYAINFGKALPATTTGSLFTVTGAIQCSLVGVVSTVLGLTTVLPTIGVTGSPAAIAAAPAVGFTSTAVGSVIVMPPTLGGQLPAAVVATGIAVSVSLFEVSNTIITVTTNATNTGNITWILSYAPLFPKSIATSIVNN